MSHGGRDEKKGPYEGNSSPHDGPVVLEYECCKVFFGSRRACSHRPHLSTVEPRMMAGLAPLRLNKLFVLTLHIAKRICHSNLQCSLRNMECAMFQFQKYIYINMNNHLDGIYFNTWTQNFLFLNDVSITLLTDLRRWYCDKCGARVMSRSRS